jgi:hypothetical protein
MRLLNPEPPRSDKTCSKVVFEVARLSWNIIPAICRSARHPLTRLLSPIIADDTHHTVEIR